MSREVLYSVLQTIVTVLPFLFLAHLAEEVDICRRLKNEDQKRNDKVDSQNDACLEGRYTSKEAQAKKLRSTLKGYIILGILYLIVLGYRIWDLYRRYEEYHKYASYEYEIFLIAVSVLILFYLYLMPIAEYLKRNTSEAKMPLNTRIEKLLDHIILGKLFQIPKHIFEGVVPFLLLSQYILYVVKLLGKFNIRPSFWPLLGIFAVYYYIGTRIIAWFFQKLLPSVIHFGMTILRILTKPIFYFIYKSQWVKRVLKALLGRLRLEFGRTVFLKKAVHKLLDYFLELLKDPNLCGALKQKTYLSLLLISAVELSSGEETISGALGMLFLFDTYLEKNT